MENADQAPPDTAKVERLAARVLAAFLTTFLICRIVVLLIMTRRMPDLFLHVGGTHVHHLNYGIFLLSGVGAYLLFARPMGHALSVAGIVYGVGLGLTFDEFGMWVHLGGSYWQRASYDAVVVIAAALALIALAPAFGRLRAQHGAVALLLLAGVALFALLLRDSFRFADRRMGPRLLQIEREGPP